jgi:peptidoglycan/LPS O-acetylase OafA/YrhL
VRFNLDASHRRKTRLSWLKSQPQPALHPAMSKPTVQGFLPRIESVRGVAALTVAAMHVTSSFVNGGSRGAFDAVGLFLIKALTNGYGAVVAFFVISGFVLARSLDANFNVPRFLRARIFRLFPAAITAILIFTAVFYATGYNLYRDASYGPLNILANMLMLRVNIDVVMWSMKAELAATPLIILCAWLCRQYGPRPVTLIAVVLFGMAFVGHYTHAIGDDTNLGPIFAFPVGVLLHFRGKQLWEKLTPAAVVVGALLAVFLFCGCSFFKPVGTFPLLVQCLSATVLVGLIAYRGEAVMFRLLDFPIVRFYGKISYSFYLLHPLALWSAGWLTQYLVTKFDTVPVSLILAVAFVYSVAAITPLAYASWRFVEWPAMRKRSPKGSVQYDRPVAVSVEA